MTKLSEILDFSNRLDDSSQKKIRITDQSQDALLKSVRKHLSENDSFSVATLNLDHLVKLRTDTKFLEAYCAQTNVVADGNPIVWTWMLAQNPVELVPGSELIEPMLRLCDELGLAVGFFGSDIETLQRAKQELNKKYPSLNVTYIGSPPFGFDPESNDADKYLSEIAASGTRICFLALGAPKQEILAYRAVSRVKGCGFVSIGAGLDFIAQKQNRAPVWVRKIAMEWLWRMLSNPKRLFLRYFKCAILLPALMLAAIRQRK